MSSALVLVSCPCPSLSATSMDPYHFDCEIIQLVHHMDSGSPPIIPWLGLIWAHKQD